MENKRKASSEAMSQEPGVSGHEPAEDAVCPSCGGRNITAKRRSITDAMTSVRYTCHDCGEGWSTIVRL